MVYLKYKTKYSSFLHPKKKVFRKKKVVSVVIVIKPHSLGSITR